MKIMCGWFELNLVEDVIKTHGFCNGKQVLMKTRTIQAKILDVHQMKMLSGI